MTSESGIYKKIYNELGKDFFTHLKDGDLNLYETNQSGELVKKSYAGRVFLHLPGSANSIETAKNILAEKYLQVSENDSLKDRFHIKASDFSDFLKSTILFEVLKITAEREGFENVKSLTNIGIKEMDQDMRFEIAKFAIRNSQPQTFVKQIKEYNLTENQRFEIFQIAIQVYGENYLTSVFSWAVYNFFSQFDIVDLNLRFESVKALAQNEINVAKFMSEFNFSRDEFFEIAKMALKTGSDYDFVSDIQKYDFSEEQRFEIAKLSAVSKYCQIAPAITAFGLSEEQRFEIAKIAAAHAMNNFCENFQHFILRNQDMRFEIAKIAALNNPVDLCHYLGKFNLNETQRFEIALIISSNIPWITDSYFEDFHLSDKKYIFELVKINARSGRDINIKEYNFSHDEKLEIARICAAECENFFTQMNTYDLNEDERYELALIAASQPALTHYSRKIAGNIRLLGITDQHRRFEFAKIAASKNGYYILRNIEFYNLTEEQKKQVLDIATNERLPRIRQELSKAFFSRNIENMKFIAENISQYEQTFGTTHFPSLTLLTDRNLTNEEIERCLIGNPINDEIKDILKNIFNQTDFRIRKTLIETLGVFLLICQTENLSLEAIRKTKPIIQELFDFRDPFFRFQLLQTIVKTLKSEKEIHFFEQLFELTEKKPSKITERKSPQIDKEFKKSFTALICMFLAPYMQLSDMVPIANIIKVRTFQNANVRNPFIRNLERLFSEDKYSIEDKQRILKNLVFESPMTANSILKNADQIACLLNFGKADAIKLANSTDSFNAIVDELLETEFDLNSIENSGEKFVNTFGSFPEPKTLFQYAATLKKLSSNELNQTMECLREFVTSVLEGDFPAMRYSTENNLHLRTIFSTRQGQVLNQEWQKGAVYEDIFEPKQIVEKREVNFKAEEFFKVKILQEGQISELDYPDLFRVLKDPSVKDQIKHKLSEHLKNEKAKTAEEIKLKKVFSFQLQVINFMYPNSPLIMSDSLQKIESLLKSLNDIYKKESHPLIDDLNAVLKSFKDPHVSRQPSRYEGFKIIDTDDPDRLLNLGDIEGSCQNVNKDAMNSKCLLSYILDGKNRAMIVTDKDGKMVARAVIRLLWDPKRKEPVFMKERTYPKTAIDPLIEKALDEACKRRAIELNLPLISENITAFKYPNELRSLDGRAPSEYVDATRLGKTGKQWTLSGLYYVK